jgi:hypothetical protein
MPLVIPTDETDRIELDELVEYLFREKIDVGDHAALASTAPLLRRLANNRDFLVDSVVDELKAFDTLQEGNNYSPQVFMLYPPQRRGQMFFLRACFWPSAQEQLLAVSGSDPFFYHKPHDHNFNFLTVGYLGPGYWSNYFEYDYESVVGYPGEAVDLRFIEKSRLHEGKVMLYRACVDVHDQLPADAFSVSLNIMENTLRAQHFDQYSFNVTTRRVKKIINRIGAPALFDAVSYLGDDGDRDLVAEIGRRHASNRIRYCALQSLSNAAPTLEASLDVLRGVTDSAPALIRAWASERATRLEAAARAAA